jgi:hypothetical protein
MALTNGTKGNVGRVKLIRRIHRLTASFLSVVLVIVAISGILLGWKKTAAGICIRSPMRGLLPICGNGFRLTRLMR